MWIVVVGPELLDRICTSEATAPLRDPVGPQRPLHWTTEPSQVGWVDALLATLTAPVDEALHAVALGHVLLAAFATADERRARVADACAHDARRLLDDGAWDWTVTRLARAVGTSPSTLARAFRRTYGRTLVQYRHEVQVARVRALYGKGDGATLQEAAALAGFGSYSQFHRVFTRLCGCSPRDYARQVADAQA
jgi:AraC-like DNA-binding protein